MSERARHVTQPFIHSNIMQSMSIDDNINALMQTTALRQRYLDNRSLANNSSSILITTLMISRKKSGGPSTRSRSCKASSMDTEARRQQLGRWLCTRAMYRNTDIPFLIAAQ